MLVTFVQSPISRSLKAADKIRCHWNRPLVFKIVLEVGGTHQTRALWIVLHFDYYCWWRKSCTSWYGKYPIIYRLSYMLGGAGFPPSTVSPFLLPFSNYSTSNSLHQLPPFTCTDLEKRPQSERPQQDQPGCGNSMKYTSTQKLENFEFEMNMQPKNEQLWKKNSTCHWFQSILSKKKGLE